MTKNLQIAIVVLVVIIGLFFFHKNSQSKYKSVYEAIFTDDPENIFKFLIQKGEKAIELARIDTMWRISGNDTLEVKSRTMDSLFDKVLKVKRGLIQSENPENYSTFSVDDSTGTRLVVIDSKGEAIGYYVFGSSSKDDYAHCNVRVGDDPKVYLADQNILYMLSTRATYWGEKPKEEIPPPPPIPTDTSTATN